MVTSQQLLNLYDMSFGKRIKEVRTSKKISQEELSTKVGIHANHLSRYERDVTLPSIEIASKIAKALEVSIDLLVFGKQDIEDNLQDNELINLFKTVQSFDDDNKKTVKDLISAFILKQELKQKLA
ncbi:helix-turn-helix protein [Tenacibaculum skagerrakense]|uniref:Helix-turn-helix protein n=1 Tax=Tenacibaculum skagerrakense TaxID=186571 RepID=A0A4R2P1M4_9FLAO|nr:helix-turn-helix transcriptional regulator [Tenacibaculum skagerrakense]TCP27968.1 helix-turn-helix protein [Tenacibaculum skagerrakense]